MAGASRCRKVFVTGGSRTTPTSSRPPSSSTIAIRPADEVVLLTKLQAAGPAALMRRIEVWIEEKQESMVFFTNHLKLAASTIAAIYKERWRVELFFKVLQQSLRIKTFVGTSANAVMIQIWTALIAMLVVKYL